MASGTAICSLFRGMNIELIVVGKTDSAEVEALVAMYAKRINRYCKFAVTTIADVRNTRNMAASRQKQLEGEMILKNIVDGDFLVLMDERGSQYTSLEYAQWLQKRMLSGSKRLVLVIGGPYGFSEEVYENATLYVPTGTESLYQKCAPWNLFSNIVGMIFTGIDEVTDEVKGDGGNRKGICYDLNGRVVENPSKGLYIINGKKCWLRN